MTIESVQGTFGNSFHVSIGEVERIRSALPVLNGRLISHVTEWAKHFFGSVAVHGNLIWYIWLWAVYPSTLLLSNSVSIIESSEPVSTNIGGQRPFSNPDWIIKTICNLSDIFGIVVASSINICEGFWISCFDEGLIVVDIHGNSVVLWVKKIVPDLWVEVKLCIVEQEPGIVRVKFHELSRFSIPFLQHFSNWIELRLVERFKSIESFVSTPFLEETFMDLQSPFLSLVVNVIVLLGRLVPVTEPSCSLIWPVREFGI